MVCFDIVMLEVDTVLAECQKVLTKSLFQVNESYDVRVITLVRLLKGLDIMYVFKYVDKNLVCDYEPRK